MELRKMLPAEFDQVFELMEQSFPWDEHRDYGGQKALLSDPAYQILVCPNETGSLTGFAALWEFDGIAYVEHFAVDPARRNGGVGAAFLQELSRLWPNLLCLEVELPANELARRRIGFYERNGFCLNSYSYMQPPVDRGRSPLPLLIMTSPRKINQGEFEQIKGLLYTRVYKKRLTPLGQWEVINDN